MCVPLGLAASWAAGSVMVRSGMSEVPPAAAPARDFEIMTADGLAIAATFWPGATPRAPAVLILHGNDSSRAALVDNAGWVAREGFAVLTIDFRGHGQSAPASRSFGLHESRDAAAAFAWLKRAQGGAPVAVIGISLGGAASLLGEAGPLPADALVLQAVYPGIREAIRNRVGTVLTRAGALLLEPFLSFQSRPRFGVWPGRLSPLQALSRFDGPVLVIGGGSDRYTPPEETHAMFEAVRGERDLWFAAGADHGEAANLSSEDYRRKLLWFLERSIGKVSIQQTVSTSAIVQSPLG